MDSGARSLTTKYVVWTAHSMRPQVKFGLSKVKNTSILKYGFKIKDISLLNKMQLTELRDK